MDDKDAKIFHQALDKATVDIQAKDYIIRVLLAHVDKAKVHQDFKDRWSTEWAGMDGLVTRIIEEFLKSKLT